MTDKKLDTKKMYEKPWNMKIDENSFELSLRILSNEFVAIKDWFYKFFW